jgi:hypothetical protein
MITTTNANEFLLARIQCMRETVDTYMDELEELQGIRLNCCALPILDELENEWIDENNNIFKQPA